MLRRQKTYFPRIINGPTPITATIEKQIGFSYVDILAMVWHGRFPQLFEMASETLARQIGLTYKTYFDNNISAPIVQMHIDYYKPLELDSKIQITASLIWTKAAKINIEYKIIKCSEEKLAATGYTVQMFTNRLTGKPYLTDPPLFQKIREKWINGDFY